MPLYLASINSGSNGNCYYVGNGHEAVMVDAGISCRETERRMARMGLDIATVKAIFISHEHTDHTRGAEVLSRRHGIPVYITAETHRKSRLWLDPKLLATFSAGTPVHVGALRVDPFPKWHDAAEPHSFTISANGLTAGVFTDIGISCEHVMEHLGRCHAAFLESNYDETMLVNGRYPLYLKRRIQGAEGHLSNDQALDLFLTRRAPWMQLLILSHLSAENNRPELVKELFEKQAGGVRIAVASRYRESEVFVVEE
jgi:phosphoribosyl 1,2-cyclic phosphodiesterase